MHQRQIKSSLNDPIYDPVHHHIRSELRLYVWLLNLDCYFSAVFQSCLVNLGERGRCDWLIIKSFKSLLYTYSNLILEDFLDFVDGGGFGLVLKFRKPFVEGWRQQVVHSGHALSHFDIKTVIVPASYVNLNEYFRRCL
jgi:hypothetical protein